MPTVWTETADVSTDWTPTNTVGVSQEWDSATDDWDSATDTWDGDGQTTWTETADVSTTWTEVPDV